MSNIAFVGLGNMGGPMAANLVKAGHSVTVFDLVQSVVDGLVEQGAKSAASATEAAKGAEFVVSMLPAGKHVEMVLLGDEGVLSAVGSNAVLIDCSTIDADTSKRVANAASEKGVKMVDAPVSGGVAAASAGTLSFMCGGTEEAFNLARPVLENMGKNIFHAGDSGAGQIAKMCNNMLLSVIMIATSESLRLGQDNGLDPSVLSEIMQASTGRNWALEVYNPCPGVMDTAPASNDYKPGFMVDLMCKDLGLAMENVLQNQSATPMGSLARNLFLAHQKKGNGQLDFSSIFESLG